MDSPTYKPYPPLWARKIIVVGVMVLAVALMIISLPVEQRDEFFWILQHIGLPLLDGIIILGIFISLMRWAE